MTNISADFLKYNALDAACTLEIHNAFWDDLSADGFMPAYNMTVDLLDPLIFMMTRGIAVNMESMQETKLEITKTIEEKQTALNEMCGRELNVNSPKDCQKYFYIELGAAPYYNNGAITVDDKALQRLSRGTAKRPGYPQAKLIQDIRGLQKLFGTYLDIEFDPDQRMRCSYNPRGTKFGRLSSSQTIFGTGCVPPTTEVLTRQGWVPISEWNTKRDIMQYNKDTNVLSFTQAKLHHEPGPGVMCHLTGDQVNQCLTPDHRALIRPKIDSAFQTIRAIDASSRNSTVMPLSGLYSSGFYSPTAPELLVASLADGSFEFSRVRIAFKKDRKIKRFLHLCEVYQISVTEQIARKGYRRFAFTKPEDWPDTKAWSDWILNLSSASASTMLSELGHWDGTIRGQSHIFYTADEAQASWIVTLAHLHKQSATMHCHEQSEASWSDTLMWTVNIKPRDYAYVEAKHWKLEAQTGDVFCPIVPSTYWLMRNEGKIAITGNTNMQNLPQEFKKFLVADPGYVLWEVDKRQAEWVVVAYLSGDANMINVVESGLDAHIHTASLMFKCSKDIIAKEAKLIGANNDPDTIAQLRFDAGIDVAIPRTMSMRQCGKKSNHGLNYDEGPNTFALINEMEQTEAKTIVELYHHIYPGIRIWYEATKRQLQKDRSLTNCFGRKVRFMDSWGPDLWKAAYSMLPQSSVVDSLNIGMVRMYHDAWLMKELNIDMLAQVHDSILMQVPIAVVQDEKIFNQAKERVYDYVSPELCYNNRCFKLNTDSKLGLNWGGASEKYNPTGMQELTYDNYSTLMEFINKCER